MKKLRSETLKEGDRFVVKGHVPGFIYRIIEDHRGEMLGIIVKVPESSEFPNGTFIPVTKKFIDNPELEQ
jgi:hypothetical protein